MSIRYIQAAQKDLAKMVHVQFGPGTSVKQST